MGQCQGDGVRDWSTSKELRQLWCETPYEVDRFVINGIMAANQVVSKITVAL
jgi:hypothetical protein